MAEATLGQLAARFGLVLRGEPDAPVHGVATLKDATPGTVTFLANPRYRRYLGSTRAAAVIVDESTAAECAVAALISKNPYAAYARIAAWLHPEPVAEPGVHPSAVVDPSARIAASAQIGPQAVIEAGAVVGERAVVGAGSVVGYGASIGADTRLAARVTLYRGVRIGQRCILHSGAVIGADGFGFSTDRKTGRQRKIPQLGNVVLQDDVEVGANTTIDRGTIGSTVIGAGTKIDNLVQIGHNCRVGRDCLIVSQVGLAGSTTVGDRVILGGQVGIAGHLHIADDVHIGAQSGVMADAPKGQVLFGTPARPHREAFKLQALYGRLPQMHAALKEIRRKFGIAAQPEPEA